jgi:small subunit ribosomal protein S3
MIERKFINQNINEFQIKEFIISTIRNAGHSKTQLKKTPMGDKVVVDVARPGLIVGQKGQNIKLLTTQLKKRFNLKNPQIEINEVKNVNLDAQIVADRIASALERFGSQRFKGIMHKAVEHITSSGALGAEILLSGKIPSSRAKTWRVYSGYLKKCGDIAISKVKSAQSQALLKTGIVGIKVKIMTPDTFLPDKIKIFDEEQQTIVEEIKPKVEKKRKPTKKKATKRKTTKKKTTKKTDGKK